MQWRGVAETTSHGGGSASPPSGVVRRDLGQLDPSRMDLNQQVQAKARLMNSLTAPVEGGANDEAKSGRAHSCQSYPSHTGVSLRARSPPMLNSDTNRPTATSPERALASVDQRTTSMDRVDQRVDRTRNALLAGRKVPQFNPLRTQGSGAPNQSQHNVGPNAGRVQVGHVRPTGSAKGNPAPPRGDTETMLKDLMGYATNNPPSEAPSSVAPHSMSAGVELERMSIEERLKRLENSMDEKFIKHTSEAMNVSVTLCRATEERLTQKIEALRREFMQESSFSGALGTKSGDVEALRVGLSNELQQTIGQEFSNLRLELAARGVPVVAGLPTGGELEAIAPGSQTRKTGIAGLVDVISDCVIEKVKEDQCIRNVSEQHDQLKEAIKELRSLPQAHSRHDNDGRSPDFDSLHSMLKEMMKISYSLAKELGTEKEQRSRDFMEAAQRLEAMEQAMSSSSEAASQALSRSTPANAKFGVGQAVGLRSLSQGDRRAMPKRGTGTQQATLVDNGTSLERVVGGLQRLVLQEEAKSAARPSMRPSTTSPTPHFRAVPRDSAVHSQGSEDGSQDWSTEVRALRSRLENIFQIGNNSAQDSIGTSSTNNTVGSLPTVQETSAI